MKIYHYLRAIQKDLLASLALPDRESSSPLTERAAYMNNQLAIKSSLRVIAFRLGSDLLYREVSRLNSEEQDWLKDQLVAIMKGLEDASSIPEAAKDVYKLHLFNLHRACGGVISPGEEARYVDLKARIARQENNSISWQGAGYNAPPRTHAGLFAYAAVWIYAKAVLVSALALLVAALGALAIWVSQYYKEALVQLASNGIAGAILQIAGISLYAILLLPRIAHNLYKDFRNIIRVDYQAKRWHSSWRLSYSLVVAAIGFSLGVFVPGGGFILAAGLALVGWVIGHSLYKSYKRWSDRSIHMGCSNPQKWHLKRDVLKAALNYACTPFTQEQESDRVYAAVSRNLPVLFGQLEEKARVSKKRQLEKWYRVETIAFSLWGIRRVTKDELRVQKVMHAVKAHRWSELNALCAELNIDVNSGTNRDFSIGVSDLALAFPSQLHVPPSPLPAAPPPPPSAPSAEPDPRRISLDPRRAIASPADPVLTIPLPASPTPSQADYCVDDDNPSDLSFVKGRPY